MLLSGHMSANTVVAVSAVTTFVALLFVASRLYTRMAIVRNAGIDDLLASSAMVFSIGTTVALCIDAKYIIRAAEQASNTSAESKQLETEWVWLLVYIVGLFLGKESILFQYLRVFPPGKYRWACYALMIITFLHTSWAFWSSIFLCTPVRLFWASTIPAGRCLNWDAIWFANSGVNIATDIAIAILPLPVLRKLDLPKGQKFLLMSVFCFGGVACIFSVLRLVALYFFTISPNQTYDSSMIAIWSSVELNATIVCSCMPTFKACLAQVFPSLISSGPAIMYRGRSGSVFAPLAGHSQAALTAPAPAYMDNQKKDPHRISSVEVEPMAYAASNIDSPLLVPPPASQIRIVRNSIDDEGASYPGQLSPWYTPDDLERQESGLAEQGRYSTLRRSRFQFSCSSSGHDFGLCNCTHALNTNMV